MRMKIVPAILSFLVILTVTSDLSAAVFGSKLSKLYKGVERSIEKADDALIERDVRTAVSMYSRAMSDLDKVSTLDPTWSAGKVAIRRDYCRSQIDQLKQNRKKAGTELADDLSAELNGKPERLSPTEREKALLDIVRSLRADLSMVVERDVRRQRLPSTAAWQHEIDSMRKALSILQTKYSVQGESLSSAQTDYESLEDVLVQLQKADGESSDGNRDFERMQSELEDALARLKKVDGESSAGDRDFERMQSQLEAKVSDSDSRYAKLEDDHLESLSEVRSLKKALAKNPAAELEASLARERRDSALVQARAEDLESALLDLKRDALTEKGRKRFAEAVQKAEARTADLQEQYMESRAEVKHLERELQEAGDMSAVEKRLKDVLKEKANLQDRLIDFKAKLTATMDTAQKLEGDSDAEVIELRQKNTRLESDMQLMKRELSDVTRNAKRGKSKASRSRDADILKLERENAELSDELVTYRKKGSRGSSFFKKKGEADGSPELATARLKFAEMEDRYLQAQAEVTALRSASAATSKQVTAGLPVTPGVVTPAVLPDRPERLIAAASTAATQAMLASDADAAISARKLIAANNLDGAYKLLGEHLTLSPNDKSLLLLMAMTCCRQQKYDTAITVLEHLSEISPSNAQVHILFGTAYMGLRQLGSATIELRRALSINPQMSEAHYNMAQIYVSLDPPAPDIAQEYYDKSVELGGSRDLELEALINKR